MSNLKRVFSQDFTVIPNEIFRHGLTLQAIGLYTFIISRPAEWNFSVNGTCAALKEGREKVNSAVKVLENTGFLKRFQAKSEAGKFDSCEWIITNVPFQFHIIGNQFTEPPFTQNPITVKPIQVKKDKVITEEVNKEEYLKARKGKFFNLINSFKKKNPSKYPDLLYEKFFNFWTEIDELNGGHQMRFEDKKKYKFFEIGKRLATFWSRVDDNERSSLWKAQEAKPTTPQAQLDFGNVLKTSSEEWK